MVEHTPSSLRAMPPYAIAAAAAHTLTKCFDEMPMPAASMLPPIR